MSSSLDSTSGGRRKRSELLQYYDSAGNTAAETPPALNIHSGEFDAKLYSQKLIKECSLKQLLEEEVTLSSTAHRLDSDCQTLVYEHYDKFLHATDLVHKLKEGSSEMEDQLQQLQDNMALITRSSSAITAGLNERRGDLSKLLSAHTTLHKLEFLFQLPAKMDECIERGNLHEGVQCYLNTCSVLQRYRHLSSLAAVQSDCDAALDRLKRSLHTTIAEGDSRDLASSVELLLQLGEPRHHLQDSYLQQAQHRLQQHLEHLQQLAHPVLLPAAGRSRSSVSSSAAAAAAAAAAGETATAAPEPSTAAAPSPSLGEGAPDEKLFPEPSAAPAGAAADTCPAAAGGAADSLQQEKRFTVDLLVFIDRCHETFVANLWLLISSYQEMFVAPAQQTSSSNTPSTSEAAAAATAKLCSLVDSSLTSLLETVRTRVRQEVALQPLRCAVMATALDKLHRRLKALETMMQQSYYTQWSMDLVLEATQLQCAQCLAALKIGLENTLADVRQGIASNSGAGNSSSNNSSAGAGGGGNNSSSISGGGGGGNSGGSGELSSLLSHLVASTAADIKSNLSTIMVFLTSGCTYSSEDTFRSTFILRQVREQTVVAFLLHLTDTLRSFAGTTTSSSSSGGAPGTTTIITGGGATATTACVAPSCSSSSSSSPPSAVAAGVTGGVASSTSASLLLVLARAAWDLHTSTAHYLLRECDESLGVHKVAATAAATAAPAGGAGGGGGSVPAAAGGRSAGPAPAAGAGGVRLTPSETVTSQLQQAAQQLLNAYVARQGSALAQLLVRSVELKDWLSCGEPRSVRRVMRTVREDIEASEAQVGSLYEEGARKERSSDSSRRTYHSLSTGPHRSTWSSSGRLNQSLNLSKLWCDRIEIYAPVQPDKLSIMTGIVKIALKSVQEAVRLRTLGRYGLQQVQVDVHYLRTHLWRHVGDDTLLNALLDEVLTAAALRCNQPQLMEHSVVEFICEQ